MVLKSFFYSLLFLLLIGCSAVSTVSVDTESKPTPVNEVKPKIVEPTSQLSSSFLSSTRIQLSDLTSSKENEIPEPFLPTDEKGETVVSEYGYRIQLISTPDREKAEEVVQKFNTFVFADTSLTYKAEAYILFKQPHFRVKVGDFRTRSEATKYNKKIKGTFRDAWIVRDKIDLNNLPKNTP